MDFKRKKSPDCLGRVLILGHGVTGLAVEDYLKQQGSRVKGLDVVDSDNIDASKEYDLCIASPGISEFSEKYAQASLVSKRVISEVEFAWEESEEESRWIAITGTNGKTTTTALTHHILSDAGMDAVAVGNIGQTCISQVDGRSKVYVAETSSYQLASTDAFAPEACAILNITPDHIKWHINLENYRNAKFKVFKNIKDDPSKLLFMEKSLTAEVEDISSFKCQVVTDEDEKVCNLVKTVQDEMNIKGEHNVQNAVCAAALCLHFGVSESDIKRALCSFLPLEHRIEPCGTVEGVAYFNDSKATNVDSTCKALSAFPEGNVCLLLGGTDKMSELEPLVSACKKPAEGACVVKHIICYGEASVRFYEAFKKLSDVGIKVEVSASLESAFGIAKSTAHKGDVVLLSPACASFDEFSNFEERGKFFKSLVKQAEISND